MYWPSDERDARMTVKARKNDVRQGERRFGQERVLIWSIIVAVLSLGGVTAAVMILRPFGS